jgi:integrase
MALNNLRLQALAKSPAPGKYTDEQGLFLKITPKGGMYWQWRLRTPRETTVSYGTYPEVGLAEARERHRQAREQRRNGVDPNLAKRKAKIERAEAFDNTFEVVAREWWGIRKSEWAPAHADRVLRRMEMDIFPRIGRLPIREITPMMMLVTARKIEARGVFETARRAVDTCSQVFRYGLVAGHCASDPAANLRPALKAPPPVHHMAAVTDPTHLGQLLRKLDGYKGGYIVRAALKLAPLLLLRPGELRRGRWEEFDLDRALWTIPPAKMKGKKVAKANGPAHLVPLPRQAVVVLRELHELTGPAGYIFPGERTRERPISDNTVNAALRILGIDTRNEMTGHGFRATARTLLAEQLGYEDNIIEAQLAHRVKDALGRAYNRTQFVEQRRAMLQAWADYLDGLRTSPSSARNVVAVDFQRAA